MATGVCFKRNNTRRTKVFKRGNEICSLFCEIFILKFETGFFGIRLVGRSNLNLKWLPCQTKILKRQVILVPLLFSFPQSNKQVSSCSEHTFVHSSHSTHIYSRIGRGISFLGAGKSRYCDLFTAPCLLRAEIFATRLNRRVRLVQDL